VTVILRAATDADYDFMRRLYHSTRAEEMQQFPFAEDQKRQFLDMQFAAQTQHYRDHYPTCERQIITRDGAPIGRLFVDRWNDQIRIVDIALIPEERGKGTGTALLRPVLEEARKKGLPVTIHVEAYSPALRLYERLGFRRIDTNGVYYLMST
jgi:GNAT superfamily N-acetyltransferase